MKRAAAVGAAIALAHAAAFVALASRSGGDELVIELAAPSSIEGRASVASEVATEGTGLVHRTWSVAYRGGFVRAVGASALVGPFQDPAAPPCGGRVVVGQKLLAQLAAPLQKLLDAELSGTDVVAIGAYQRVEHLNLQWAELDAHVFDRGFVGDAPHGYIRADADIVFERVRVPLVLALVPERGGHVRVAAHASVDVGNRLLQWISDSLGGDKLATRLARRQIDGVLATTLAPPPPFALGDGQELAFGYCDGDPAIADGDYGALPFAVMLRGGAVRPPLLPAGAPRPPRPDTTLALDLDVNALNGLLAELWRTGWLDRRLAEVGLDRRFAEDPTVAELLSLRISSPKLALPPVISAGPTGLRLAADARLAITDGSQVTTGRVYGAVDFGFLPNGQVIDLDVSALELACERTPTSLVPCYADLVAALRDRGPAFHGALTDAFASLVTRIFSEQRLGTETLPIALAIHSATASGGRGVLHLELDAAVVPTSP